jgi:hypothetical protein
LQSIPGIRCLDFAGDGAANYAYFPILIGPDYPIGRDALYDALKRDGIHPRRYIRCGHGWAIRRTIRATMAGSRSG